MMNVGFKEVGMGGGVGCGPLPRFTVMIFVEKKIWNL